MIITNLSQVGKIYLLLCRNWKKGRLRITIKKGESVPYDNVLIDNFDLVSAVYQFLLRNWDNGKLQIFCKEDKNPPPP